MWCPFLSLLEHVFKLFTKASLIIRPSKIVHNNMNENALKSLLRINATTSIFIEKESKKKKNHKC